MLHGLRQLLIKAAVTEKCEKDFVTPENKHRTCKWPPKQEEIPALETIIFRFHVKFWGCISNTEKGGFSSNRHVSFTPQKSNMDTNKLPRFKGFQRELPFPRLIILGIQRLVLGTVGHVEVILILLPAPCPPRQPSSRHHRCLEIIVDP